MKMEQTECSETLAFKLRLWGITQKKAYEIHHLFVNFKKAHDSDGRDVLHNILIEFGSP
jgi:hypothetical protein